MIESIPDIRYVLWSAPPGVPKWVFLAVMGLVFAGIIIHAKYFADR